MEDFFRKLKNGEMSLEPAQFQPQHVTIQVTGTCSCGHPTSLALVLVAKAPPLTIQCGGCGTKYELTSIGYNIERPTQMQSSIRTTHPAIVTPS